ncbi:MAG: acetyltransferase [Lachnospiraceae bacterium]|nr:acetyltransferase [Lachnospiraceae bacterium]
MKEIVIVGNGGFAKEVKWLIDRINKTKNTWEFKGYIDVDVKDSDVIGNDDFLLGYKAELAVVVAIGSSKIREKLVEKYKVNKYIYYPNLIDPSVIMSDKIVMGQGNIICAGAICTVNISIGNFNIINLDCTIGHDTIIKDYLTINPSVNISGGCIIDNAVNLGTGVQVIQGIKIGERTTVGAGAAVISNLPSMCLAVGVPAKIKKWYEE